MPANDTEVHVLDLDADRALLTGEISGLAMLLFRNERPLAGLAGKMDWRFAGEISSFIKTGAMTGELGQCAYVPVTRHGITFHLLLVGAGDTIRSGQRGAVPPESLAVLNKNLRGLKLTKVAVSRADFGQVPNDYFTKTLKGCRLWIVN